MSASSPGSVMLRAATAASGGTGAPDCTYCSIWDWTERTSAWTSMFEGPVPPTNSTRGGDVRVNRLEAEHADPLLALDDRPHGAVLELDDLRDLGQRTDGVELGRIVDVLAVGLALRDQRDRRVLRRRRG